MSCSFNWICTNSSRLGCCEHAALESFAIHFQPVRARERAPWRRGRPEWSDCSCCVSRTSIDIARLHHERRDVDLAAVHVDVAVADHLAGLRAAGAEAHAVDDVVQAALEHAEQVLAGDALLMRGLLEQVAELAFEDAVDSGGPSAFREAAGRSRRSSALRSLPCWPGTKLRFSIAHFSVWQRSPFRNNFMPSRRHSRQTGPIYRAN